MAQQQHPPAPASTSQTTVTLAIPDRAHFELEEIAQLLNVPVSRVQSWVRELRDLFPAPTEPGRKHTFSRLEVEQLIHVGRWLVDERCPLSTVRQRLISARTESTDQNAAPTTAPTTNVKRLAALRNLINARPHNMQEAHRLISRLQQALSDTLSTPEPPPAPEPPPPPPAPEPLPPPLSGSHRKVHPVFTLDPPMLPSLEPEPDNNTQGIQNTQWRVKYEALQAQFEAQTEELAVLRARYAQLEALSPASAVEAAQALTKALEDHRRLSQKLDYQVQYQRKLSRDVRAQLLALIEFARTF